MGELGNRLREARESQGLSLQQAEETTRIRLVFLEALEEERFDELPGDVYARGFIRNYAQFLGLDQQELLASFNALRGRSSAYHAPKVLDEPLVPRPTSNRWARVFLAFMLLVLLVASGWYIYQKFYLGVEPGGLLIPKLMPLEKPAATSVTPNKAAPTQTRPSATKVTQPTPSPSPQATRSTPNPTAAAEKAPTNSPPPSPRATSTQSSYPAIRQTPTQPTFILVEAKALETTWLRVHVDAELVFGNFLEKGDSRTWEAEREISIRVGNAAGLGLTVNGVEVDSLGEPDEVILVEYTLDSLPGG